MLETIIKTLESYNYNVQKISEKARVEVIRQALNGIGIELVTDTSPSNIRKILETAGNQIGSVHFIKRSDGNLRRMSYRLHVKNPKYAKRTRDIDPNRRAHDMYHSQLTVFDVNKVLRGINGEVIGRGAWRTVPLENVTRIVAGGKTYLIFPNY